MNKFLSIVGTVVFVITILTGCSSTPKVENVRAVRGQVPYQFGQAPEQRVIENGGKQYDRHVRSLQDARLRHEEAMVEMEYRKRELEYARTNGLAPPQSSAQSPSGPPVVFQQQAWPAIRPAVAFVPDQSNFIIGPDDVVGGYRPVRQVRDLNGYGGYGGYSRYREVCPTGPVRYGAGGGGYTTGQNHYTQGNPAYTSGGAGYTTGHNNYVAGSPAYTQGGAGYTDGRNNYVAGNPGYTTGRPGYITNPGNNYRR